MQQPSDDSEKMLMRGTMITASQVKAAKHSHCAQLHKVLSGVPNAVIQLFLVNTCKQFECTQFLKLLNDICNVPTLPHSVTKKDKRIFKENIIMYPMHLFNLAVAPEDPESSYNESIIISTIQTPIFPLIHYPSFGIDCNNITFNLRCTHCKYKQVPSSMLEIFLLML